MTGTIASSPPTSQRSVTSAAPGKPVPEMNESLRMNAYSPRTTSAPISEKNTEARSLKNNVVFLLVNANIEEGGGAFALKLKS